MIDSTQIIKQALLEFPETRGNDKLLILKVWELQGLQFSPEQKSKFLNILSSETIRRTRQKLQQLGQYLPSKEIQKKRKELADIYRLENRQKKLIFNKERQLFMQI
jgi:hypothetical protein